MSNKKELTKKEQIVNYKKINFKDIPSNNEFQKIKVSPKYRWFNSIIAIEITIIGICLGIIIGYLIVIFA